MRSSIVMDGHFRVFEDGSINRIKDGEEVKASIVYTGRNRRQGIVSYYENGKQYREYVHRLVAMAFVPNPNNYTKVHHKDGNTKNNNASNLEWITPRMNGIIAYKAGLIDKMKNAHPCKKCGVLTISKRDYCLSCRKSEKRKEKSDKRKNEYISSFSFLDLEELSELERERISLIQKGFTCTEVAKMQGVSKQAVHSMLERAKALAVARGEGDRSMFKIVEKKDLPYIRSDAKKDLINFLIQEIFVVRFLTMEMTQCGFSEGTTP